MKIKLSMHVITMNRAEGMFRLLSMTEGIFDAIRVCDGGSIDRTEALCGAFGCEYYEREWDDDMSAQHNLLLSKAKPGEWIFIMDDDEAPSAELAGRLREYAKEGIEQNYQIIKIPSIMVIDGIADWTVEDLSAAIVEGKQKDRFTKMILFRYDGKVKYSGTSHYGLDWEFIKDWKVREMIPEPYWHYKSPVDIVRCNIQQGFINPEMQGIDKEIGNTLHKLLNCHSLGMLKAMEDGNIGNELKDLFFANRLPELGSISDYFRYYFLFQHPEDLDDYDIDLFTDPAIKRHLKELGGYRSYTVNVTIGDTIQEWLPLGHLSIHHELRKRLNTNQLLWAVKEVANLN